MTTRRVLNVLLGAFLALLAPERLLASPIYLVQEDGATQNDRLLRYDGGVLTTVGLIGFGDVRGLAYNAATNTMFGVSRTADRLLSIDLLTGAGTPVGPSSYLPAGSNTAEISVDAGGTLYGLGHTSSVCCLDTLYTVNQSTGVASTVGAFGPTLGGLASQHATGMLYATAFGGELYTLNSGNGAATAVGVITGASGAVARIAFDQASNTLFGISTANQLVTIDLATLIATPVAQFGGSQIYAIEVQSARAVPEPTTLLLVGSGVIAAFGRRAARGRRRPLRQP